MIDPGASSLASILRDPRAIPALARRGRRAHLTAGLSILFLPAVFACIAATFAYMAMDPIPALTPDSMQYLSAAQNLAGGHGFVTSITDLEISAPRVPFVDWPPLYPILLSLGAGSRSSSEPLPAAPLRWARWLNLLSLAGSFFPLAFLAHVMAGPRGVVPVLAFYAVFRPVQLLSSFAWSESLFILLTLSTLATLVLALRPDPPRLVRGAFMILAGLLAAAAAATRYVGLTVPAAGAIAIILCTEGTSGRRTGKRLLLFLVPAILPIAFWLLRNLHLTGHLFGEQRLASLLAPEEVLLSAMRTVTADWINPPGFPERIAAQLVPLLGLCSFVWLAALALRRYGPQTMESPRERLTGSVALTAFALSYLAIVIITAARISYDPLSSRLLAPVYPALLLLGASLLRGAYVDVRATPGQRRGLLLAGMLMLTLNTLATTRWVLGPREDRSLSWPYWRSVGAGTLDGDRRAAIAALTDLPADAVVLSNIWETVALHGGRPVKPLPGRAEPMAMQKVINHPGAYLLVQDGVRADRLGSRDFGPDAQAGGFLTPMFSRHGIHLYQIGHASKK